MNCKYHNNKEAKFICEKCKRPICEECAVDVMGKKVCKNCITYSVFETKPAHRDSLLEKFVFFCFAVVPGAGQMYLGLFKRGFQLMVTFIAGITVLSYASMEAFIPLVMIPTWFYSFLDSYHLRKRIREGENIEDMEAYSYKLITDNKLYVGIVLLLIGIMGFANVLDYGNFFGHRMNQIYWVFKRSLVPLFFVLFGMIILLRSKREKEDTTDAE